MSRWTYITTAVLAVALVLVAPQPADAAPLRVLLVGDSITEGTDGDTGYRCDLWGTLPTGSVDFLGLRPANGSCGLGGFDTDHDGRGGATTAERTTEMNGAGSFALSYDAALVHIGTNDKNGVDFGWTQSYVSGTLEPAYRNLIANLRQNNPSVTIYLAQLIPCGFEANPSTGFLGCDVTHDGGLDNNGQPVEGINDVWARIAADSSTGQSPIVLVDHRQGFSTSADLKADSVHPNASGRAKMAGTWAAALAPQLPTDEVLLVEPNGRWHIRVPGQPDRTFWYGNPGDVPLFGDWDGDGTATPGMWRSGPGGGFAYLTNALPANGAVGVAQFNYFFGIPGDQVFVGDWNNDGKDTLGINRGGHIFLTDSHADNGVPVPTNYDFWFGAPGDRAFGANTDGIEGDSLILYRPTNGFSYYTHEIPGSGDVITAGNKTFFFGQAGDRFTVGDWNDDGRDTPGIYRPDNSTVYLTNDLPTGGQPALVSDSYQWPSASSNWQPVAGDW
ncbi:MAG: hypothetical protein KJO87_02520 [Acidimicrobiia bacterium]|nr:hypothetical protein [Acidimicrobiia bacterium]